MVPRIVKTHTASHAPACFDLSAWRVHEHAYACPSDAYPTFLSRSQLILKENGNNNKKEKKKKKRKKKEGKKVMIRHQKGVLLSRGGDAADIPGWD
jgi:hypothetical protein